MDDAQPITHPTHPTHPTGHTHGIPASPTAQAPHQNDCSNMPTISLDRFTALVIDDQEEVREYVRLVLETLGIGHVVTVGSGRDALAAVTSPGARFDLILCDLQMPESDGVETLRALAAMGVEAWVVVMSVEEPRIIETAGMLATAQGLHVLGAVQKPVDHRRMAALLAHIADTEAAPSRAYVAAPPGDLPDAFRRGEMQLHYQPKVHMKSGRFTSAEALVRWQHPTLGLIMPGAFVPLVESSAEFAHQLNEYALQEAIRCAGRWRAGGRNLAVSVNLSASAFDRLDLPERIEAMARDANVPNDHITLELTETQVARDAISMSEVSTRLRLKRFNLSVDDFGTGNSGLSQLRQLPFNEIKIDRGFVHGCSTSFTQRSVVEASLALARDLGMTSVAEGVETREDWNLLAELGCDVVQGYYVARPMSELGLARWVPQWQERVV